MTLFFNEKKVYDLFTQLSSSFLQHQIIIQYRLIFSKNDDDNDNNKEEEIKNGNDEIERIEKFFKFVYTNMIIDYNQGNEIMKNDFFVLIKIMKEMMRIPIEIPIKIMMEMENENEIEKNEKEMVFVGKYIDIYHSFVDRLFMMFDKEEEGEIEEEGEEVFETSPRFVNNEEIVESVESGDIQQNNVENGVLNNNENTNEEEERVGEDNEKEEVVGEDMNERNDIQDDNEGTKENYDNENIKPEGEKVVESVEEKEEFEVEGEYSEYSDVSGTDLSRIDSVESDTGLNNMIDIEVDNVSEGDLHSNPTTPKAPKGVKLDMGKLKRRESFKVDISKMDSNGVTSKNNIDSLSNEQKQVMLVFVINQLLHFQKRIGEKYEKGDILKRVVEQIRNYINIPVNFALIRNFKNNLKQKCNFPILVFIKLLHKKPRNYSRIKKVHSGKGRSLFQIFVQDEEMVLKMLEMKNTKFFSVYKEVLICIKIQKLLEKFRLKSPVIVNIVDYWNDGFVYKILMNKYTMSLKDYIIKQKDLSFSDRMVIYEKVLKCYSIIARSHIIHLDIKLDNILINVDKNKIVDLVLNDFGESLVCEESSEKSQICQKGQLTIQAPEVTKTFKGEGITCYADIWSLALLFFEILVSDYLISPDIHDIYQLIIFSMSKENYSKNQEQFNHIIEKQVTKKLKLLVNDNLLKKCIDFLQKTLILDFRKRMDINQLMMFFSKTFDRI